MIGFLQLSKRTETPRWADCEFDSDEEDDVDLHSLWVPPHAVPMVEEQPTQWQLTSSRKKFNNQGTGRTAVQSLGGWKPKCSILEDLNVVERMLLDDLQFLIKCMLASFLDPTEINKFKKLCETLPKTIGRDLPTCDLLRAAKHYGGCIILQGWLDRCSTPQVLEIQWQLLGHVLHLLECSNGNHVVKKMVEVMKQHSLSSQFIVDEVIHMASRTARHKYGCRTIRDLVKYCSPGQVSKMVEEILQQDALGLCWHPFGNYVAQEILKHGLPEHQRHLSKVIQEHVWWMGKDICAMPVVTQALCFGTVDDRLAVGRNLLSQHELVVSMVGLLKQQKHGGKAMKALMQLLQLPGKDERSRARGLVMQLLQLPGEDESHDAQGRKLSRHERPIAEHLRLVDLQPCDAGMPLRQEEEGEQHQQEQEEQDKASTCAGGSSPGGSSSASGNEAPQAAAQPSTAKSISSVQMLIPDLVVKARKPRKGSKERFVGARRSLSTPKQVEADDFPELPTAGRHPACAIYGAQPPDPSMGEAVGYTEKRARQGKVVGSHSCAAALSAPIMQDQEECLEFYRAIEAVDAAILYQ